LQIAALVLGRKIMGFSLELFFEELQFILTQDKDPKEIVREAEIHAAEGKMYAKECGQIKE
tara:strand:- start:563 stop:745 length:183 start_codon:yes stop_codon:yes gene_type:complete